MEKGFPAFKYAAKSWTDTVPNICCISMCDLGFLKYITYYYYTGEELYLKAVLFLLLFAERKKLLKITSVLIF